MDGNGHEDDDKLKDLGPFTVKHAMKRDDWPMFEEAINVEFFGHQKIGTFRLEE